MEDEEEPDERKGDGRGDDMGRNKMDENLEGTELYEGIKIEHRGDSR